MKTKKILALVLTVVMLLSSVSLISFAGDVTTVLTGSDFQHPDGNEAGQKTVDSIVAAIKNDGIEKADGFIFCGDYDHDLTLLPGPTGDGVKALTESVDKLVDPNGSHVFVQGNHDSAKETAGLSKSGNNDPENGKYGVFVINEDDYMWLNFSSAVIRGTVNSLRNYLNEKIASDFTAPIFVVSHLPLHYTMRTKLFGDAKYARYILDILNEAGAKGLNIIFLYGHDHASGWDDYLGGAAVCLEKGDTITISKKGNQLKNETETINFTYMNAGFTGYYDNHNGADDALTMSVFQIYDDRVVISRYDANGKHNVSSAGVINSYKNEKTVTPNTDVKASPLTVELTEITDKTPLSGSIDFFAQFISLCLESFEQFMRLFVINK